MLLFERTDCTTDHNTNWPSRNCCTVSKRFARAYGRWGAESIGSFSNYINLVYIYIILYTCIHMYILITYIIYIYTYIYICLSGSWHRVWCQVFETVAAITTVPADFPRFCIELCRTVSNCVELCRTVSSFGLTVATLREGTSTGVERVSSTVLAAASRAERCAVNAVDPALKPLQNEVSTQLLGSAGIMYALRVCNWFFQTIDEQNYDMSWIFCGSSFQAWCDRLLLQHPTLFKENTIRSSLPSTASECFW